VSDPLADRAGADAPGPAFTVRPAEVALLASVFIVAACGLVYELAAGTLASYLLGDSILQFSTVIGTYLFAMGVGSWLSRYLERQLVAQFLRIELLVGLIGGLMPAALFALQSVATPSFRFALYALVLTVGILVGLEIPLVMRILKRHAGGPHGGLKTLVSQVLTFDYLGALAAAESLTHAPPRRRSGRSRCTSSRRRSRAPGSSSRRSRPTGGTASACRRG